MAQHTFLVEIGTAELPPKALRSLAEAFADNFKAELTKADLAFGDVEWFASPRRLALKVSELAGEQPSKSVEKRGPAVAQAFDAEGKPTKAAEGWARGNGITVASGSRAYSPVQAVSPDRSPILTAIYFSSSVCGAAFIAANVVALLGATS